MFPSLSADGYEITPIKLTYLNDDRDFIGDFTLSGSEVYFSFQEELSSVIDFDVSFDSVNFLTDRRSLFSNNRTQSTLAVYEKNLPNLNCSDVLSSCANYWVTMPVGEITQIGNECIGDCNILPLKNNFSESHTPLCTPCYRDYTSFNFGENGLDNFKPELLYKSTIETQYYPKDLKKFTFRLPDWSDPLSGDALNSFKCFGSLNSTCSVFADTIIWDNNGTRIVSFFQGDECSGSWSERFYSEDNIFFDTPPNSLLTLVSGVDYEYVRPSDIDSVINEQNLGNENDLIFILDCVSSDVIVDASPNNLNGNFVI